MAKDQEGDLHAHTSLQVVLDAHQEVLADGLGTVKGVQQPFTLTPQPSHSSTEPDLTHIRSRGK